MTQINPATLLTQGAFIPHAILSFVCELLPLDSKAEPGFLAERVDRILFRQPKQPPRNNFAATLSQCPKFHFKLIDTSGEHDLLDETVAQIEAIKLARSLRTSRPHLVGRDCSISVVDEMGKNVCRIPIDDI
ncbi:hypothetical protein ACVWYH_005006 [Bradyrhizobium sp. GM24.11]